MRTKLGKNKTNFETKFKIARALELSKELSNYVKEDKINMDLVRADYSKVIRLFNGLGYNLAYLNGNSPEIANRMYNKFEAITK